MKETIKIFTTFSVHNKHIIPHLVKRDWNIIWIALKIYIFRSRQNDPGERADKPTEPKTVVHVANVNRPNSDAHNAAKSNVICSLYSFGYSVLIRMILNGRIVAEKKKKRNSFFVVFVFGMSDDGDDDAAIHRGNGGRPKYVYCNVVPKNGKK